MLLRINLVLPRKIHTSINCSVLCLNNILAFFVSIENPTICHNIIRRSIRSFNGPQPLNFLSPSPPPPHKRGCLSFACKAESTFRFGIMSVDNVFRALCLTTRPPDIQCYSLIYLQFLRATDDKLS